VKLLFLSFYYQPDLCAGSFRSTALISELAKFDNLDIDVITTFPNRYASYSSDAPAQEINGNVNVHRIALPDHQSGMLDQAKAFFHYYSGVNRLIKGKKYDAVYATSSRLFTAFLGARISRRYQIPLYLDIRDIFVDTIKDVLPSKMAFGAKPFFTIIERYAFSSAERINLVSKGFESYFKRRYSAKQYRWFTNGIDEVFINKQQASVSSQEEIEPLKILYAGNLGEGQGLHNIIPGLARSLGKRVVFRVIGDGGRKAALQDILHLDSIDNVELLPPVSRDVLIDEYSCADILFLHLNDYPAFEKVLPSKIFEYAAMGKPILAGVNGYSAAFIQSEVFNAAVFYPGNVEEAVQALESLRVSNTPRTEFIERYRRTRIMSDMAADIVGFVTNSGSER